MLYYKAPYTHFQCLLDYTRQLPNHSKIQRRTRGSRRKNNFHRRNSSLNFFENRWVQLLSKRNIFMHFEIFLLFFRSFLCNLLNFVHPLLFLPFLRRNYLTTNLFEKWRIKLTEKMTKIVWRAMAFWFNWIFKLQLFPLLFICCWSLFISSPIPNNCVIFECVWILSFINSNWSQSNCTVQ